MGTYTINKNLYLPTIGEQGWGTLVNGNFETIDNFLKPISLSGSTYTFTGNQTGGTITATKITNSGTLTQTGTSTFTGKITANGGIGTKALTATSISNSGALTQTGASTFTGLITANGGVKGNVTGNIQGFLFIKGTVGTSGDENYATCAAQSGTVSNSSNVVTFTVSNYQISYPTLKKHAIGVYTRRSTDLTGTTNPSLATRKLTLNGAELYSNARVTYYDSSNTQVTDTIGQDETKTLTVKVGTNVSLNRPLSGFYTYSIPTGTTYKVKYATP